MEDFCIDKNGIQQSFLLTDPVYLISIYGLSSIHHLLTTCKICCYLDQSFHVFKSEMAYFNSVFVSDKSEKGRLAIIKD